jgi:hypothetical protein
VSTKKPEKKPAAKKSAAKSAKAPTVKVQSAAPLVNDAAPAPAPVPAGCPLCKGDPSSQTWNKEGDTCDCHECGKTYSVKTGKQVGLIKIQANRAEQNGVTRPSTGTFCARVWQALDKLHAEGTEITIEAVRAIAGTEMADATVRTQRQRWRTFVGLPRNAKAVKTSKPAAAEASNSA